jgi:hypothetical protein
VSRASQVSDVFTVNNQQCLERHCEASGTCLWLPNFSSCTRSTVRVHSDSLPVPLKIMKISLRNSILCLALFSTPLLALHSQTATPAKEISMAGKAYLTKNHRDMLLVLTLTNTSDHEITVLTRKLEFVANYSNGPVSADFTLGYMSDADEGGHVVVPSVYELAPVTLAPNEQAVIKHEVLNEPQLEHVVHETDLVCTYRISDAWAKRLKVSGITARSQSFRPIMIHNNAMPQ